MTKKNIIFLSISLVLIILLGIGVSYSMWSVSVSQDTNNTAYTECFDLSITNKENNISLNNAYPISNDKGKSLTPYTFTVTNTCDITAEYSVNLEVLKDSTLSSKFIDIMLESNDIREINLLSNFENTDKVNTSSIESRKLTTGILKSRESKDYSLRLWIDYNTTLEDLNNEVKSFKSKIIIVGKPINFNYGGDMVFNFDYTGSEQTFIAPVSGTYKLETWGAQGGTVESYVGIGYGGYSDGTIELNKDDNLYLAIGGNGSSSTSFNEEYVSSYNGGGNAKSNDDTYWASGGGATSIHNLLINDGMLKNYKDNIDNILIVSGGGGGGGIIGLKNYDFIYNPGGTGGGFKGGTGKNYYDLESLSYGRGGTQIGSGPTYTSYEGSYIDAGGFGQGGNGQNNIGGATTGQGGSGGGGGFYGGTSSYDFGSSAGGGSGYIGNPLLKDKVMYCYNCEESNEESTKTISTTCSEETPTSYCAKKGNGYARITLVSIDE